MDRSFWTTAGLISLPFVALFAFNIVSDPLAEQREWMADQLAAVALEERAEVAEDVERPAWLESVNQRPSAWAMITTPPEAPKPAAPPKPEAPKPPDLKQMMEGVRITKAQIGDRIRIITPEFERGAWFVKGDTVKGLVLSDFDKTTATFTFDWKEGGKVLELKLPRDGARPGGGGEE